MSWTIDETGTKRWVKQKSIHRLRDKMKRKQIFSGKESVIMWNEINNAHTIADLRDALYGVCCKLQEFESEYEKNHKE
jgi:hypothetical protein